MPPASSPPAASRTRAAPWSSPPSDLSVVVPSALQDEYVHLSMFVRSSYFSGRGNTRAEDSFRCPTVHEGDRDEPSDDVSRRLGVGVLGGCGLRDRRQQSN